MTDTAKLKKLIKDSGLKFSFIADSVGLSRSQLYKKVNNDVAFNQYEITALCKVLNIKTLREKENIFFAENVD